MLFFVICLFDCVLLLANVCCYLVEQKELGDKHTDATDRLRQLLPVPKRFYEVISVEPFGTLVDTKGNRITGFDSIAKKQVHCLLTLFYLSV